MILSLRMSLLYFKNAICVLKFVVSKPELMFDNDKLTLTIEVLTGDSKYCYFDRYV